MACVDTAPVDGVIARHVDFARLHACNVEGQIAAPEIVSRQACAAKVLAHKPCRSGGLPECFGGERFQLIVWYLRGGGSDVDRFGGAHRRGGVEDHDAMRSH